MKGLLTAICRYFWTAIKTDLILTSVCWLNIHQQIDGKFKPPHAPPNQGWENRAFWLSQGFILDFGGMGVNSATLFCPRL